MQVLVIGGSGNISYDTVERLLAEGHQVTTVTRGQGLVPPGCRPIQVDVKNRTACAAALAGEKPDCIVNFLAFTPDDARADYDIFRGRTAQYVFISSTTVYEKPHKRLPITEDTPRGNPFSQYARNKIATEDFLHSVHAPDFPVTIVRPSHTFGHTWIPSPISGADFTVARRILDGRPIIVHDDGQSLWTLTHTTDFAVGIAGLAGNAAALGETFHITSDQALTWNAIYQEIGWALGRDPEIVHIPSAFLAQAWPEAEGKLLGDKAENAIFDNAKIKRFVRPFDCAKSFRAAIRESVAWLTADPARQRINAEHDRLTDHLIAQWRKSI